MSWHYENLKNKELQRIAVVRFGNMLRPLNEIGREAVIKELKKYDKFLEMKEEVRNVSNSS
jgi:hypothetical protein